MYLFILSKLAEKYKELPYVRTEDMTGNMEAFLNAYGDPNQTVQFAGKLSKKQYSYCLYMYFTS